jgi:hypothetical protein
MKRWEGGSGLVMGPRYFLFLFYYELWCVLQPCHSPPSFLPCTLLCGGKRFPVPFPCPHAKNWVSPRKVRTRIAPPVFVWWGYFCYSVKRHILLPHAREIGASEPKKNRPQSKIPARSEFVRPKTGIFLGFPLLCYPSFLFPLLTFHYRSIEEHPGTLYTIIPWSLASRTEIFKDFLKFFVILN